MRLVDLGERQIVNTIIPKYCRSAGDDCALVSLDLADILITTDPVPTPAADVIGGDSDPYWMGWLLVVINASDLAAGGAQPLAFTAAIEARSDMEVAGLERFLEGVTDACDSAGLRYVGGNLREGSRLGGVGTAIGRCSPGKALHRHGAGAGDVLFSIGAGGHFWRDALTIIRGGLVPVKDTSPIFRPYSQIRVMHKLASDDLISAAIDNSDGLLPSLQQLANASNVSIELDLDSLSLELSAELEGVDLARLWLGWGDWNVIAAVRPADCDSILHFGKSLGVDIRRIGHVVGSDSTTIVVRRGSRATPAPRLESERFSPDSWFITGISSYVDQLLSVELP